MNQRAILPILAPAAFLVAALTITVFPAASNPAAQGNPTEQQQTIAAAVNQFFTQTAEAQAQIGLTQTVEAAFATAQTATAAARATAEAQTVQPLTATAAFQATVQAGFNAALTATAQAMERLFPGLDVASAAHLTVRDNRAGDVTALALGEVNVWTFEAATRGTGRPVDQSKVQDLLDAFDELTAAAALPPQDLGALGLDQPGFTILLETADGLRYRLQTGAPGDAQSPVLADVVRVTADSEQIVQPPRLATVFVEQLQPLLNAVPNPPETDPPPLPDPTRAEIQVAEQVFEQGRMVWVQPVNQIWVLTLAGEGRGDWLIFEDTFMEGEPEIDPSLEPPEGLLQPRRGFGKLWRENPELREALGWAITPEFGYISPYEYQPGGTFDAEDNFTPGPGFHILFTLGSEELRFNEDDGTWQLGRQERTAEPQEQPATPQPSPTLVGGGGASRP